MNTSSDVSRISVDVLRTSCSILIAHPLVAQFSKGWRSGESTRLPST